jgi:hypothetical protein
MVTTGQKQTAEDMCKDRQYHTTGEKKGKKIESNIHSAAHNQTLKQ